MGNMLQKIRTEIIRGDCIDVMAGMADSCVDCVVTSPPYYAQRIYGQPGLGNENTPEEYIDNLCDIFDQVRRVLANDGTLWLNLGDKYQNKQLLNIPHRVAEEMRARGWLFRADITINKLSVFPTNPKDRPENKTECLFLFAKSSNYFYDRLACVEQSKGRRDRKSINKYMDGVHTRLNAYKSSMPDGVKIIGNAWNVKPSNRRNKGNGASFDESIPRKCISLGCRPLGTVLDPFSGAGTTIRVASELGRNSIGIEVNPEYVAKTVEIFDDIGYTLEFNNDSTNQIHMQ